MTNVLAQKAVLASVTIRQWSGHRLDRRITDEVNKQRQAQADAGRYNKLLLGKTAFAEIDRLTNEARTKFLVLTMPWLDTGTRILPTAKYDEFAGVFRKYREEFNTAADLFTSQYPRWVKMDENRLGDAFRAADYPDARRVRSLFGFDVGVMPCPDIADFRVKLAKEQMEDIRSDLDERLKEALQNAMKDPINRVVAAVGRMVERLNAYQPGSGPGTKTEGWFRDSLVTNLQELVTLLPAFNLTGDKALADLTARIEKELCTTDAGTLRKDEAARTQVREAAEEILAQAEALMA